MTFASLLGDNRPDASEKIAGKRCVYRGAGAPCNLTPGGLSASLKKLAACAPNFHCQSIEQTSGFSEDIERGVHVMDNILYGHETNFIGRPINYLGGPYSIPSVVSRNMKQNAINLTLEETDSALKFAASDMGLCRPSKALGDENPDEQHKTADSGGRVDYISQISPCNSTIGGSGSLRTQTCPVFDSAGNYLSLATGVTTDTLAQLPYLASRQNTCGNETLNADSESPFTTIEALPLTTPSFQLVTPSLVRDACLRRPGEICHDDFDCVPNKFHSTLAALYEKEWFGNTKAEHEYWQQGLVCGQGASPPTASMLAFSSGAYNMGANRCCRRAPGDLTIYTFGTALEENAENPGLRVYSPVPSGSTTRARDAEYISGADLPTTLGRYSRYTPLEMLGIDPTVAWNPFFPVPQYREGADFELRTPERYQWKTISETAGKTCCGGGWVRKFADKTHTWPNTGRLNFDVNNFKCINYTSPLALTPAPPTFMNAGFFSSQVNNLCLASHEDTATNTIGCAVVPIKKQNDMIVFADNRKFIDNHVYRPIAVRFRPEEDSVILDTRNAWSNENGGLNVYTPYAPEAILGFNKFPVGGINGHYPSINEADQKPLPFFAENSNTVAFKLPIYIDIWNDATSGSIDLANLHLYHDLDPDGAGGWNGKHAVFFGNTIATAYTFGTPTAGECPSDLAALTGNEWCLDTNGVMHFHRNGTVPEDLPEETIRIGFIPFGSELHRYKNLPFLDCPNEFDTYNCVHRSMVAPADSLYYLTKLSRFELLGIPQIVYEPIYCTSDQSKLVQGLFYNDDDRNTFETSPNAWPWTVAEPTTHPEPWTANIYDPAPQTPGGDPVDPLNKNADGTDRSYVVNADQVKLPQVFSSHEFLCCLKAGMVTTSSDSCCSGFSAVTNGTRYCKLPPYTDLHVYLNRFVSGDGELTDLEYVPMTGEPKPDLNVYAKIRTFGIMHCSSGDVIEGGAMGKFIGEPTNSVFISQDPLYSIVDSINDEYEESAEENANGSPQRRGFELFNNGARWNHHLYCKPPATE
jgi:hypothetical protein